MSVADLLHQKHKAQRTARESPWATGMARVGILARAIVHLLVGWLAVQIAFGDVGEQADQRGALATVIRQPLGQVLVFLLALGFLAYAAWRFVEAIIDPDDKGPLSRLGYAARGLLYLGLFGTAVSLIMKKGSSASGNGGSDNNQQVAGVLGLPFGRFIVAAVALAVVAVGVWNGYQALTRSFEKKLKEAEMSSNERTWTIRVGVFGHLARMVAYLVVGWFLGKAALQFDPQEPVGLDQALHALAGAAYGPFLLVTVGVGFVAFGAYQVMLARYREVFDT